ncbi:MAG: hypothetical protein AAGC67_11300 [Myxococcota bacterium]
MSSMPRMRAGLACLLFPLAATGLARAEDAKAVEGRVIDANTREPIANVSVFEAVPGERLAADVRRFARVREALTDEDGRFRFEPVSRGWFDSLFSSEERAPRYHVYHESYGLTWRREEAGQIELSLRDTHLRYLDAARLCRVDESDLLHARVQERHCPPADPERFANGAARWKGAVDGQGRRKGFWKYYREDGSLIAVGRFFGGAAKGGWEFHRRPAPETDAD